MAQQSTAIAFFGLGYNAAPDADSFFPASLDGLREILAELRDIDPTGLGVDLDVDGDIDLLTETVIPAAERGIEILVAHDEDGYYFARRCAESQTFAVLVPCERISVEDETGAVVGYEPCQDGGFVRHTHVAEESICPCGAVVALEGPMTEGDDPPFYRARSMNGEWTVRCPECGAEHLFVEAA